VEISIRLGVADVIADVCAVGRTLTEAGLKKIGEPLMKSEAILISHSEETTTLADAALFIKRLKGIIVARNLLWWNTIFQK
jgi:ATP phosphoribosyltransferase